MEDHEYETEAAEIRILQRRIEFLRRSCHESISSKTNQALRAEYVDVCSFEKLLETLEACVG